VDDTLPLDPNNPPPPGMAESSRLIKPSQQIPHTTFWNYTEQHFRLITDDDVAQLVDTPVNQSFLLRSFK
jgi:hypothetical protein